MTYVPRLKKSLAGLQLAMVAKSLKQLTLRFSNCSLCSRQDVINQYSNASSTFDRRHKLMKYDHHYTFHIQVFVICTPQQFDERASNYTTELSKRLRIWYISPSQYVDVIGSTSILKPYIDLILKEPEIIILGVLLKISSFWARKSDSVA